MTAPLPKVVTVTGFSPGDRVTITPRPDAALAVSAD